MHTRQGSTARRLTRGAHLGLVLPVLAGCGNGTGPVDATTVPYGQTTFVVVMNPAINSINTVAAPAPDTARVGVSTGVVQGPTDVTDSTGVATLNPVATGDRTLTFRRDSL